MPQDSQQVFWRRHKVSTATEPSRPVQIWPASSEILFSGLMHKVCVCVCETKRHKWICVCFCVWVCVCVRSRDIKGCTTKFARRYINTIVNAPFYFSLACGCVCQFIEWPLAFLILYFAVWTLFPHITSIILKTRI